jgi:hypothetical protein
MQWHRKIRSAGLRGRTAALWLPLCLAMCCFFAARLGAQVVTVQLFDGKNGKPIRNVRVVISFPGQHAHSSLDLTGNAKGEIRFDADGATRFAVRPRLYSACSKQPESGFSVADVLKTGLLSHDDCGQVDLSPQPGRLLFFAKRGTLWNR